MTLLMKGEVQLHKYSSLLVMVNFSETAGLKMSPLSIYQCISGHGEFTPDLQLNPNYALLINHQHQVNEARTGYVENLWSYHDKLVSTIFFLKSMSLELNLKHGKHTIRFVEVYLYTDEHVVIPRYSTGVYGSVFRRFLVDRDRSYHGEYYVIKNKLLAVDRRKGQRCNYDGVEAPVGRCIVKNLEENHNCTVPLLMASKTKEFCPREQLGEINAANNIIQDLSEADLANLTGCLPSCNRDEIYLKDSPNVRNWPRRDNPTMSLKFLYHDGSFDVREEYLVYDISSLMADVGGYLGLLVGQSILGIYYMSADWVTEMKLWRCV